MDRKSIYQGIQDNQCVPVVEVEGNVLAAAREDVMSIPELSGRRMVKFNFFRGMDKVRQRCYENAERS